MTILQREKIFSRTRILNRISLLRKNLKSDEISMKIMLRSRIFSSTIISRGRNTPLWWCYLAQVSKLYDFFFNNARKEESNLLSSICIFQPLLSIYRRTSSSHLHRSISRKFVRTEIQLPIPSSLVRTAFEWNTKVTSREKSSINGDLEVDLKKWVVKNFEQMLE